MIGTSVKQTITEPVYSVSLSEMNDKQLESQSTRQIWLCEITPDGPRMEDIRRRARIKEECERRGKAEIFARAKERVLRVLRKTGSLVKD